MAKTNNPFKMIGSYIGFTVGIYFAYNANHNNAAPFSLAPLWFLMGPLIGFLIGWGVQEFYRRFFG